MLSTKLALVFALYASIVLASPVLQFRSAELARPGLASRNLMERQRQFQSELDAENALQTLTEEEEFAQEMNNAAYLAALQAAAGNIQRSAGQPLGRAEGAPMVRRQDIDSETAAYMQMQQELYEAEMQAQNQMESSTTAQLPKRHDNGMSAAQ